MLDAEVLSLKQELLSLRKEEVGNSNVETRKIQDKN